jgi:predicted enzyme related to lactoylglutathione lyase
MTQPTLSMVTLHVKDIQRAISFYRDVLGLPEGEHVPAVKWAEFKLGGVTLGLHEDEHEQGHRAPGGTSGFYLTVPDVDAFVAKAERHGARVADKPQDFPYGRVGSLLDPDGNELMFIQG